MDRRTIVAIPISWRRSGCGRIADEDPASCRIRYPDAERRHCFRTRRCRLQPSGLRTAMGRDPSSQVPAHQVAEPTGRMCQCGIDRFHRAATPISRQPTKNRPPAWLREGEGSQANSGVGRGSWPGERPEFRIGLLHRKRIVGSAGRQRCESLAF